MPPLPMYAELQNSGFLDLTSYQSNSTELPTNGTPAPSFSFNVALVLDRANPVADLLNAEWASRQTQIEALNNSNTLWQTYGADQQNFSDALAELSSLGFAPFPNIVNGQYVTSAESRTIWVTVDESNFATLFGTTLLEGFTAAPEPGLFNLIKFWEGNLKLPQELIDAGVVGLWFDSSELDQTILANPGTGQGVVLPEGPQGVGNSGEDAKYPNEIAELYNFPFADPKLWNEVTGTIGLVEPGIGNALEGVTDPQVEFDARLTTYREGAGITDPLKSVIAVAAGGEEFKDKDERALDVGIATTVNPNSQLVLYAGSGHLNNANTDALTAYQSAIWDTVNNPQVVSSSFSTFNDINPFSPFYQTLQMLYEDALLRNITMINAAGDGGSGAEYPNGLTNVEISHASALSLVVGVASLSTGSTARTDPTLKTIYDNAIEGDRATVWQLVAGGLTVMPWKAKAAHALIETAWNSYEVVDDNGVLEMPKGYYNNNSGAGGVDTAQQTPSYQVTFGLNPVTSDSRAATGRGIPDVAAVSGGNMKYIVPKPDIIDIQHEAGTSGAAPLWASLILQIDTIFADQNLPQLGFMNDLLYTAAVIAPASFNDITLGTNTSSFLLGGSYHTAPKDGSDETVEFTPTGYGYSAGPGYDLATGLGTPNGVLLARALTWIAHSQMSFANSPELLSPDANGWESSVNQNVLIQVSAPNFTSVTLEAGSQAENIVTAGSDAFAWTSRFAQQVLQPDFDRALIRMFDHQSQGALLQMGIGIGDQIDVTIDAVSASAPQGPLSTDFGFVDFVSDDGSEVRIARPVAVAETVGGEDDQGAVIRMRQGGKGDKGDYVLKIYRVDDFDGTIDGLKPGDPGYGAAANERAYETKSGKTSIKGPGYLDYKQAQIVGIDAGDIVAMKLRHNNHTYYAFAEANETVNGEHVAHLWNYGDNTWGWEGNYKGKDFDYNDLVVQIDFTSAYGEGWLV